MTTLNVCTSRSRTWGWRPCSRRGTLTTTSNTSRWTSYWRERKSSLQILLVGNFRAREPMLRHMRLLLRHMPMWSPGMIPSKFPGEATFVPELLSILCSLPRAAKFNSPFPGTPTWSRRSTRTSLGITLKPIIVYIVSPQMFSTCLILPAAQHPLYLLLTLSLLPNYQQLEQKTWVIIIAGSQTGSGLI